MPQLETAQYHQKKKKKSHVLQVKVPLATQRSPVPKLRPNTAKDRNIKKKKKKLLSIF